MGCIYFFSCSLLLGHTLLSGTRVENMLHTPLAHYSTQWVWCLKKTVVQLAEEQGYTHISGWKTNTHNWRAPHYLLINNRLEDPNKATPLIPMCLPTPWESWPWNGSTHSTSASWTYFNSLMESLNISSKINNATQYKSIRKMTTVQPGPFIAAVSNTGITVKSCMDMLVAQQQLMKWFPLSTLI